MSRIGLLLLLLTGFLIASAGYSAPAHAQSEHQLIRRLVVFPLKADKGLEAVADEAWWQAREEFTKSRRFLVASKQFLVKSDVFQPRGDLEPADSIILGKLLDAHALVTLQLENRRLIFTVYDGGNGLTIFRKAANLHPSLTINDQLASLSRRMVNDYIASIPYQGFTVVDSLIGRPVFEESGEQHVRVDLGIGSGAQIGDITQWILITSTNAAPVFQGGAKMTVFAEGRIVRIEEGVATVEIVRASSVKDIKEFTLVRVPREADRLQSAYLLTDTPRTTLTTELVAPEANPLQQVARERKPLVTALSFVGSVAAFLLLAF
jgi:hypothetical protein